MRVVCLGSGPSLTPEDVALCRGTYTVAINNTIDWAPWADVAFAADKEWWEARDGLPDFQGQRVALAMFPAAKYPQVKVYGQAGITGLCTDGERLCTGKHSGYSAINYAAAILKATEIVLLGYDMQPLRGRHHWHEPHPGDRHPSYTSWLSFYDSLKEPLTALGVRVLNASRATAIPPSTFPHVPLREVLYETARLGDHPDLSARAIRR